MGRRDGKPTEDLTDRIFGKWRVIGFAGKTTGNSVVDLWECQCDPDLGGCGDVKIVNKHNLIKGHSQQCLACAHKALGVRRRKGLPPVRQHPSHSIWMNVVSKGCQGWTTRSFAAWYDANNFGRKRLRKRDANRPHGPDNSYYSDQLESTETRCTIAIEYYVGKGMDWKAAEERVSKLSRERIRQIVCQVAGVCRRCDSPIWKGVFCEMHYPKRKHPLRGRPQRKITIGRVTRTLTEWSEHTGVPKTIITARLRMGGKWTPKRAVFTPVHTPTDPSTKKGKARLLEMTLPYLP